MTTKTIAASVALIAASLLVLTGCADGAGPATPNQTEPSQAPTSQGIQQPAAGDTISVEIVDVIDPTTVRVVETEASNEPFIVHVAAITAPAEGECGYSMAMDYAVQTFTEGGKTWTLEYSDLSVPSDAQDDVEWIAANGDHTGNLSTPIVQGYALTAVMDGFAIADEGSAVLVAKQAAAQQQDLGLWAVCDGFGQ